MARFRLIGWLSVMWTGWQKYVGLEFSFKKEASRQDPSNPNNPCKKSTCVITRCYGYFVSWGLQKIFVYIKPKQNITRISALYLQSIQNNTYLFQNSSYPFRGKYDINILTLIYLFKSKPSKFKALYLCFCINGLLLFQNTSQGRASCEYKVFWINANISAGKIEG